MAQSGLNSLGKMFIFETIFLAAENRLFGGRIFLRRPVVRCTLCLDGGMRVGAAQSSGKPFTVE